MKQWKTAVGHLEKYKYFFLIIAVGVLLMVISIPDNTAQETAESGDSESAEVFDLDQFEQQICDSLAAMDGVGRVEVMLSLESGEESVYASDVSRSSQSSGTDSSSENYQSTMSILSDGSYGEQPVLIKNKYPTFRGAVVICDGADSSSVQLEITEAISSLCGISSDHISILKMSQ